MALEMIMDVAEIDDLGIRVVAGEPRALAGQHVTRPSRVFALWATALAAIALVGLLGRVFERPAADCCVAGPAIAGAGRSGPAAGWPSTGHSSFRYQAGGATTMTMRIERVPGLDGSIARLDVGGRIDGPVGNVAIQLVSGGTTFGEVTRYYAPIGGRPPSPFGAFDLSFDVPGDTALRDLWIIARAYVSGKAVAIESLAVDPPWPQIGPDKYVIDDFVGDAARTPIGTPIVSSVRRTARVLGLGWQVDPYAR